MHKDISYKRLYNILSNAAIESFNTRDISVKTEILEYEKQYEEFFKDNKSLDIFDEWVPTQKEVARAKKFCSLLNKRRLSTDVYNEKAFPLKDEEFQLLADMLDDYRPYIAQQNPEMYNILERSIKRNIPQYREEIILSEYNQKSIDIIRKANREKKKGSAGSNDDKRDAVSFFEELKIDNVKSFKASPAKIELYLKCLKMIDFLPKEKYGRLSKFRAKYNLNKELYVSSMELGGDYKIEALKYQISMQKFAKAIDETVKHMQQGASEKAKTIREKYKQDEYLYK